jgi:5-methylcytosine-specific restriction endonuclease McrA
VPKRTEVDRGPILALLATLSVADTARKLGLHFNTVNQIARLKRGMCASCGQRAHKPGFTKCAFCADRERSRTRNKRREARLAGHCTMCPKPLKKGSTLYCAQHYKTNLARQTRFRLRDRFGEHAEPLLKKADGRCQICGGTNDRARSLDIHHIDGDDANGSRENLVAACHNCHRAVHLLLRSKDLRKLLAWFEKTYG